MAGRYYSMYLIHYLGFELYYYLSVFDILGKKIFIFRKVMSTQKTLFFSQRKYLLFVIYHTVSGFLDSFDGILARALDQKSLVGQYFEHILDQYAHFVMYTCIGLLYPTYIVYFYLEIALELWHSGFSSYIQTLPKTDQSWLHKTTSLSSMCQLTIHNHPNLRLLNWYGPDVFHTLLVIRFILTDENTRRLNVYIKRYISLEKVHLIIRYGLYFTGFFTVLRTVVTSCYMLDNLEKLAKAK